MKDTLFIDTSVSISNIGIFSAQKSNTQYLRVKLRNVYIEIG